MLLSQVNYKTPEFEKLLKTDLQTYSYSDNYLKVKVFKIYVARKGKKLGRVSSVDSTDVDKTNMEMNLFKKTGMTGGLNDKQIFDKFTMLQYELSRPEQFHDNPKLLTQLQDDLNVIKILLERQKKTRIHGNIMTPTRYEQYQLENMINEVGKMERKFVTIK